MLQARPVGTLAMISRQWIVAEDKAALLRSLSIDRHAEAAPRTGRRVWPGLLGLLVLIGALAALGRHFEPELRVLLAREQVDAVAVENSRAEAPPPSDPAPAVAAPSPPAGLIASGYVVARRKATIAAETTGKIVAVLIDEGMTVAEGQVVAELDDVLAEKDLELARSRTGEAEAGVAVIAADLADAERIHHRLLNLSERSFASEADLTKAEARVEVLRAQHGQAHAQLESARLEQQRAAAMLGKYKIRAPFAGIVTERSAQPGEMISPLSSGGFTRTGICTVVDMDSIEIEVDVNEAFIGRVRAGGKVSAVLDAYPDWTIPAKVIAIVPTANREKATVKVRIGIEEKDPRLLPEMAVKATFLDNEAVPSAAAGDRSQAAEPDLAGANRCDS